MHRHQQHPSKKARMSTWNKCPDLNPLETMPAKRVAIKVFNISATLYVQVTAVRELPLC